MLSDPDKPPSDAIDTLAASSTNNEAEVLEFSTLKAVVDGLEPNPLTSNLAVPEGFPITTLPELSARET